MRGHEKRVERSRQRPMGRDVRLVETFIVGQPAVRTLSTRYKPVTPREWFYVGLVVFGCAVWLVIWLWS